MGKFNNLNIHRADLREASIPQLAWYLKEVMLDPSTGDRLTISQAVMMAKFVQEVAKNHYVRGNCAPKGG